MYAGGRVWFFAPAHFLFPDMLHLSLTVERPHVLQLKLSHFP